MDVLEPAVRLILRAQRVVAAVLTGVVLTGGSAEAQAVSGSEITAAFLLNFARFAEWPADVIPARMPLALCVHNDGAVADALERTIKGRTVGGHGLAVRRLTAGAPLSRCHVLYLGGSDLKRSLDVIGTVNGVGLFTVSNAARFAQAGGVAELYLEGGRMRIAVNVDALQRAQIQLSSRVLALAKIVKDPPAP
jgi:hypothetical protein